MMLIKILASTRVAGDLYALRKALAPTQMEISGIRPRADLGDDTNWTTVHIRWDMNHSVKQLLCHPPLVGTFNIEADVLTKGIKVGANGLEPSTSRM